MGRRLFHRRARVTAAIAVIATAGGAAIAVIANDSAAAGTLQPSALLAVANAAAARSGDATPTAIYMSALTTRSAANMTASQDTIPTVSGGNNPAYLIVERGNFTLSNAQGVTTGPEPTGTVLTLVVDAGTGQVTDGGVQDVMPNLAALGTTTQLR